MQGVELARRFALVPLGPPSLSYSSTCRAMLTHNDEAGEVQLVVDRAYKAGERVYAWCGPQPNSRLILNYGIVDEGNPYDKLSIVATMINTGPLFQMKRKLVQGAGATLRTRAPAVVCQQAAVYGRVEGVHVLMPCVVQHKCPYWEYGALVLAES